MGKALIVGASGQVGTAIAECLGVGSWAGTYRDRVFPGGIQFSLQAASQSNSAAENLLSGGDFGVVYLCAGWTRVDDCEDRPREAFRVNRDGPAAVAAAARAVGAKTVYLSTEYVFDGRSGPYSEDDHPNPINVYGRSKLEGEHSILEIDPDALVVRTTVVFGPETQGKNFAYQLLRALDSGQSISVPADQCSSPTYNRDLAAALIALVDANEKGVFNVVGPEVMDRATLGRRIARTIGSDEGLVLGVDTASLHQTAARPLQAGLRTDKLRLRAPDIRMRPVEEAIRDWLGNQRGENIRGEQ